jgi:hypothetical protein
LVGLIWADAYQLIYITVPSAFAGIPAHDGSADRSTWVYFSFVTLTTIGYGALALMSYRCADPCDAKGVGTYRLERRGTCFATRL